MEDLNKKLQKANADLADLIKMKSNAEAKRDDAKNAETQTEIEMQ